MKIFAMFCVALSFVAVTAFGANKTYQVTGTVKSVTADTIVVEKGKELWEIARGAAKTSGDPKVGSKVTIEYRMTAATITVKK